VLDAIVYHLDVVTCAAPPDDAHAWLSLFVFRCDLMKKRQNLFKPSLVATRTHGRPSSCCLVATTHTAANIVYSCASALVLSTFRVFEVFIAAIENDISLGKLGHQALEDLVPDTAMGQGENEQARL